MYDIVGGPGNLTSSWQPQPQTRGTFSILSTCFVTLALCTWKIVHLNLPGICPDDDLKWRDWWKADRTMRHKLIHLCGGHQLVRQIGWLVIGLFAPELIAFAAFKQYWDARELNKYMKEVYVEKNRGPGWWPRVLRPRARQGDVEDSEEKRVWSMTHSFYAVMGGFTFTMREGSKVYIPDDRDRNQVTLRHEALRFVAKHEPSVIPKLTASAIVDKSNASVFVKIITLFQAIWFSIQCMARMGQNLSVSLLELTTFAHCICALLIGAFWLQKPLDISETESSPLEMPRSIRQPQWLMALLYTLSSFDKKDSDDVRHRKEEQHQRAVPARLHIAENQTSTQPDVNSTATRPRNSSHPEPWRRHHKLNPARTTATTLDHSAHASSAERRYRMRIRLAQKGWDHYVDKPFQNNRHSATVMTLGDIDPQHAARRLRAALRDTLVDRVHNFPRRHHLRVNLRTHLGITLTGFLYGGLHLLAWYAPFGSEVERVLWRAAGLTIAGSGLLVPMAHVEDIVSDAVRPFLVDDDHEKDAKEAEKLARLGVQGYVRSYQGPHEDVVQQQGAVGLEEGEKEDMRQETASVVESGDGWKHLRDLLWKAYFGWAIEALRACRLVVVVIVGAVYFGLRVFIFLECLVNIAYLPESAYEVVRWSQYVPHIS